MKTKKIPTVIGIILLVFSLAAGVILVQYRQLFKLGATGQIQPKDVRISNIAASSFVVSWTTDVQTTGFIKYGESQSGLGKSQSDSIVVSSYTHLAKISGLKPATIYYFKINSGGDDYDNNGIAWQSQTAPTVIEPSRPILVSGSVLTTTGVPAKNALVYVSLAGGLLSATTSQNGSWVIPISSARTGDLSEFINIDMAATLLEISVQAGPDGIASAQVYPQSANPIPAMVLGQTYDFKNLPANQTSEAPQVNTSVPDQSNPVSGFNLPENSSTGAAQTVTLESVKEGETVSAVKPEFLGKGPSGTTIEITVESQSPITDQVTIPDTGDWKWSPPADLPEGIHKITISWKDAAGITRTLTRNFVVQASEGPSYVATPSATPQVTTSPTPTATATSSATLPPVPQSGVLTPTLILSIMGIGVLAFAFFLWKQAET